jgi:transcriptional regulator with XRE-family HTH domain
MLGSASSRRSRISRLAESLGKRGFRHGYMARQLKAFLAQQIRALRGDRSQAEFGAIIGKPQSVVSRLEKQADRQISVQTLIDIAERLDIAVIIRFVDFPTFLRYTEDYSDDALAPASYTQAAIDLLAAAERPAPSSGIPTPTGSPILPNPLVPEEPRLSDPQVIRDRTGPIPLRVISGNKEEAAPPQPIGEMPRWAAHQARQQPLEATGS